MVEIRFTPIGFDVLSERLRQLSKVKDEIIRDTLWEAANLFIDYIKELAPRSTNLFELKETAHIHYDETWGVQQIDSRSVTIGTPEWKLALYLEYGTAPHPIVGHRKVLHWVSDDGEDHFALYVRHPGFPAMPHIRPAIARLEIVLPEIANKNLRKHFTILNK